MGEKLKEGVKYDVGKLRMDLIPYDSLIEVAKVYTFLEDDSILRLDKIPFDVLIEVAKVYTFGASKYEVENWRKGMGWKRIFGAIMRHGTAWYLGKDHDDETDLNPLTACIWGCLAILNYSNTNEHLDDRIQSIFSIELNDIYNECVDTDVDNSASAKEISWSSLYGSFLLHLWQWYLGEDYDEESGIHHMAWAAYYVFDLLFNIMNGLGTDDRFKTEFNMNLSDKALQFLKEFKEEQKKNEVK